MNMKSKGIAYLLWFFCGLFGAHKFYLGRPFMGVLYLCTGGLFTIGWFFDLFTLGRQVDIANMQDSLSDMRRPIIINNNQAHPANMAGYSAEKQILMLSEQYPVLDIRQVVAGTHLDVEESEAALAKLVDRGIARLRVDADGKASYDFS
jgi:hypothetical protein